MPAILGRPDLATMHSASPSRSESKILPKQQYTVAISAALLFCTMGTAALAQGDTHVWGELQSTVSAIQKIEGSLPGLPEAAILSEDKDDARDAIRSLMTEAFAVLASSDASRTLSRFDALAEQIRQAVQEISEAELARLGAPDTNEGICAILFYVCDPTKTDYDDQITAANERIRAAKREQESIKIDLQKHLRSLSIDVPDGSLDSLLASVAKGEMVNLASAYANVAAITDALHKSTLSTSENLEVARRYYGIYTILVQILVEMQVDTENRIENVYIKKIDEISAYTATLLDETERQLRDVAAPEHISTLEANVDAQRLTLQAAAVYREHLVGQLRAVQEARGKAEIALEVAENTERTVNVSADLTALIQRSAEDINSILAIKPPVLRPFESLQLKREFESLTERIAAGS